jgi:hypothetical protein
MRNQLRAKEEDSFTKYYIVLYYIFTMQSASGNRDWMMGPMSCFDDHAAHSTFFPLLLSFHRSFS